MFGCDVVTNGSSLVGLEFVQMIRMHTSVCTSGFSSVQSFCLSEETSARLCFIVKPQGGNSLQSSDTGNNMLFKSNY